MKGIGITSNVLILGDFNMKSITQLSAGYSRKVENHIKEKFNLRQ